MVVAGLVVTVVTATCSSPPSDELQDRAAAAATPSWRLETSQTNVGRTATPSKAPEAVAAEEQGPLPTDEIVTPEQLSVANRPTCPSEPRQIVSVLDFGAKGDGLADDTAAIQKANNAVAASGGRVEFPPGLYRTYNVVQDSCVEFASDGGATLKHPDGTSPGHVVKGRVISTTGSIGRRSRVLTVESTRGIAPGVLVAIQAAGGKSRVQQTTLAVAAPPGVNAISVRETKGLKTKYTSFLFLGDEIISYNGISGNRLNNVRRGLLGTTSVHHQAGTVVAQAQRMYAVVVRVSGKRVILDGQSWASARDTQVDIGSVGMSIKGLTLDGNRRPGGSPATNPFPLKYDLARWLSIRDSTIQNGDHGAISLDRGTRDSVIEGNMLFNHGDPANNLGAAIWLYRGPAKNIIRDNTIYGRTFVGIMLDDRSEESTEYDAEPTENTIEGNKVDIPNFQVSRAAGIVITGANRNKVLGNTLANAETGIMVANIKQGPFPSQSVMNSVRSNTFLSHGVAIQVSGSDNEFIRNSIRNTGIPTKNSGRRNRFSENTVEP